MRGIAALSVVFSHVGFIKGGAFGVDLFFIISGFIMVYITRSGFDEFIKKRFIRVVPLYWFMTMVVVFLVVIKPGLFSSTTFSYEFLIKSLLFIPFDRNGYIEPLLGVGWTLNYEMFFYLIFFVSMKISHKNRIVLASFIIFSMVIFGLLLNPDDVIMKFFTSPLLIEFIFGMVLCNLYLKDFYGVKFPGVMAGFSALCIYIALFFVPGKEYGDFRFLVWGVPTLLVFYFLLNMSFSFFGATFLSWVGKISYSLYLTHLFVIHGFDRLLYPMDRVELYSISVFLTSILISFLVAYVVWFIFEYKFTGYLNEMFLKREKKI